MARKLRRYGPYLFVLGLVVAIVGLLGSPTRNAEATVFSSPHWFNDSPQLPCTDCGCGCPQPSPYSRDGVGWLDGGLRSKQTLFTAKGMTSDLEVSIGFDSFLQGMTQVGNGMILSFEHTVEEQILNPGDPSAPGGHQVLWRRPSGQIVTYVWDGQEYSTQDCSVHHVLTHNSPYKLTDKYGNVMLFDAGGMPDKYIDRNGNALDFTYNGAYQIIALTDTRGGLYTFSHNTEGFLSAVQAPSGDTWQLGYDTSGNLTTVVTPPTPQQPFGITTTLSYDGMNRLTGIKDGRGNTVYQYDYVGGTPQVDKVKVDAKVIDYTYAQGRTERKDRNGNIHRTFHGGANITKTDMLVNAQSRYATLYTYSGTRLVTIVYPRGNRIDFTWDAVDNLLERRHKTTNTPISDPADRVYAWTYAYNFRVSHFDAEGSLTSLTRDTAGNLTRITHPTVSNPTLQAALEDITYNSHGQVTSVTDEEGKVTNYHYFAAPGADFGLLEKIEVDPTGLDLETVFAYDVAGNVSSVTDPRGEETLLEWDSLRRLLKRTAPGFSYEKTFEYDGNGNVTKSEHLNKDKDGSVVATNPWITTTYAYSVEDRVTSIVEETGATTTRTTSFDYDANGNRLRTTKPEGNKTLWDYDERDLVSAITRGETSSEASTQELAYDLNANLVTLTDGRGNDTTYDYDLFDRRTKTTDPIGHYSEVAFDKNGRATQVTRKSSGGAVLQRRSYAYDERGRLWEIADLRRDPSTTHGDAITQIERFKTGHARVVTDARGKTTEFGYDSAWRRTSLTDAMGNETAWTLDANGNATAWSIEEVDGQGTVTHDFEAVYDQLNRRTSFVEVDRTDANNRLEVTYGYDSRGHLVWKISAKGGPTRWSFDAAGRMRKKEVATATGASIEDFTAALVTEWAFDDNDRLTSHTDDAGNDSAFAHDELGRVTELAYPNLDTMAMEYDENDNLTKTTDAAGNVIDDTYDDNGRLTARTVTRAAGFLGTTSETFTYDGLGRMTKAEDNDYKIEFTYGEIGLASRVYEETQSNVGGAAHAKTVTRTYDAVGNKLTELYPSGMDLDYAWNEISMLSTVSDGTYTLASVSYIGGRRKQIAFLNGATAALTYTGFRGEVERVHHVTSGTATIVDLQYGYDANHDRGHERFGGSGSPGNAFDYDNARRLSKAWMGTADVSAPTTSAYTKKIEYTMDDDGNRTAVKVTPYGQSATTTSYTDNNLNQYTAVGGATQAHDKNGSLTDDGALEYEYDYKNQVVRVKQGAATIAEYKYDALGRRVEKDDQTNVERYIYSDDETICVYDGSDNLVRDFVFGAGLDDVLMVQQADVLDYDSDSNTTELTRCFYHRNALGSVVEISDMSEAVAVSYRYDPYGSVTITRNGTPQSSDPLGNPWMFTSRFHDEETGLEYYRRRHYSPETGRFLQRDLLGYAAGPNQYQYVDSLPTTMVDPLGLQGTPTGQGSYELPPGGANVFALQFLLDSLFDLDGDPLTADRYRHVNSVMTVSYESEREEDLGPTGRTRNHKYAQFGDKVNHTWEREIKYLMSVWKITTTTNNVPGVFGPGTDTAHTAARSIMTHGYWVRGRGPQTGTTTTVTRQLIWRGVVSYWEGMFESYFVDDKCNKVKQKDKPEPLLPRPNAGPGEGNVLLPPAPASPENPDPPPLPPPVV